MEQSLSIAVLPFVNMSSDVENEYFSDGMTEEIINALAKLKRLKVTSRTSSFYYKNKNLSLKNIGLELGVSAVLEGSIRRSDDTIRITAQLIDTKDDFHFWSETWDRKLENVFDIQDEISLLIADKLRENFGHFEIEDHLVNSQTTNFEAYENYLKGNYHFQKWNHGDIQIALQKYQRAIHLDSKHAESYLGIAKCYNFLGVMGLSPTEVSFEEVKKYLTKALALNDQIPEAYYLLSNLSFWGEWDISKSLAYIDKAIEINPNYAIGHQFKSFVLILINQKMMALKHVDIAIDLDPRSSEIFFAKGYIYYMLEDYERSLELMEMCLAITPEDMLANIIKGCCFLLTNRADEVINMFSSEDATHIDEANKIGMIAIAHAFKSDQANVAKYHKLLEEKLENDNAERALSYLFLIYVISNQSDRAFDYLQKAVDIKSPLIFILIPDPLLNPIKSAPRYKAIFNSVFGKIPRIDKAKRVKKVIMSDHQTEIYAEKLNHLLAVQMPYLDSSLSLRALSEQIGIHPNQLSWLINERFQKNFNEFINQYRVEAFKRKAKDPKNAHLTLIGLAYESGFNSKTVFNTFFKKETGITPKEYLNKIS
ncbi:transcriptional regulator, AraC family [Reichenbachiella faecimaris]|uniref:Transcriptional regulator, AraC family n=1 Tax=Reichenbachiella faecimaris TaxID=692418 RepID=A0A1W2GDD7_REIFA|nr:helix-turn-helix domain-containing protein [Reichenbachiella faecimaris]SMD34665.1 transcriptional regulator, AraC family [Reichenbachiella faecimaris]